ncbi:HD domain-containing protein [Chitinophaga filiformis]|uniref:HD domain-containing protein n=1 Tax=Chitinophaga filiformis TaxID=104663 RepID=UPI001F36F066|nr:HD domain-containing protein [Chitinophaga filiformis]MCF6408035.1 HD domain-containing protein [Chitinophaga filiformis]
MVILADIEEFARQAHGDQQRKFADEPYIQHPIRVMQLCREYTSDLPVLSAALLHDVLEDTAVTKEELSSYLRDVMKPEDAQRTLTLTVELTDIYVKKNYPNWNRRKRKNAEAARLGKVSAAAQTIKYADIIDNSLDISNSSSDFKPKFLHECRALLKVMDKGNPELRQRAIATVNSFLEK